jgi:thiamine transport system ATP-binding protein
VLYVTHDQDEALSLADRVAVMRAGRLVQTDTPDRLWRAPRDRFVAGFLGLDLVLEAQSSRPAGPTPRSARCRCRRGDGAGAARGAARRAPAGRVHTPRRPRARVPGTVTGRRFAGDHTVVTVAPTSGPVLTVPVWRALPPEVGTDVVVALDPTRLHPLESA